MKQTQYRESTTAELFPLAYQQDLMKKQAEHFVNKSITNGNVQSGYENMPVEFPKPVDNLIPFISHKPPQLYIKNYLKNNWKPLLLVGASAAVLAIILFKAKQHKENKKRLYKPLKNN